MSERDRDNFSRNGMRILEGKLMKLQEFANKEVKKAVIRSYSDYFEYLAEQMHKLLEESVKSFYGAYTPSLYKRTSGLTKSFTTILEVDSDADDDRTIYGALENGFDKTEMTTYREVTGDPADKYGLFDIVYNRGWHGGAARASKGRPHPEPGRPYWRCPDPSYKYWFKKGHRAKVSTPPEKIFTKKLDDFYKNEKDKVFAEFYAENIEKMAEAVLDYIRGI